MEEKVKEADKVKHRYQKRQASGAGQVYEKYFVNTHLSRSERELHATRMLKKRFKSMRNLRVLEIGAGHGDNLFFLQRAGIPWSLIYANEMIADRLESLGEYLPNDRIFAGDFLEVDFGSEKFDLVLQSTVFSSILNEEIRAQIVEKAAALLKPHGCFLWYDMTVDNPQNPDIQGISIGQINKLFSGQFKLVDRKRVTLAPPIGRRVGRLYNWFNVLFPFLRSHVLVLFEKVGR